MKRFIFIVIAFCFVFAGSFEVFSQTRTITKKRSKGKLVKCYEKGKIVYRTKCRIQKKKTTTVVKSSNKTTKDVPYGLPNAEMSGGGQGSGRGQGTGNGDGLGNGNRYGLGNGTGDGLGNGSGGGLGNGRGDGNGNGSGNGDGNNVNKETTLPVSPTTGVKILSKPRALYTDAARENGVTGKVVLRVTFSANGTIGAISVISGLGNGLTEQAIEAARKIRFEPATRGGVPYTITKPVEYNFTPY